MLAAVTLAGCGLTSGPPSGTSLTVTKDFGHGQLREAASSPQSRARTALRVLEDHVRVTTGAGGAIVSVDGNATRAPFGWSVFVNGVAHGPSVKLHDGDRVWWDLHDRTASRRIPAVVGSFPEPFRHGVAGRRLPVRVECVTPDAPSCGQAAARLTALGVPAARAGLQTSLTMYTLRVLVGPWPLLRVDPSAALLASGPRISGVYARPADGGRTLVLLDARGRETRRLGPGTGLVAATRLHDEQPVWLVTGTDEAGVGAAAAALAEDALGGHFALAVTSARIGVGLPEVVRP